MLVKINPDKKKLSEKQVGRGKNRIMLALFLRLFSPQRNLISLTLTLKIVWIAEISDLSVVVDKKYLDLIKK